MHSVETRITHVRSRIALAARAAGRDPASVRLLAVSKSHDVEAIRRVSACGVRDFAENYVAEALPKIEALAPERLVWHFIGAIQSNKTREIATCFDWVHTVDRERIARRLSDQRPEGMAALNVLIQLNIDREREKAGVPEEGLAELVRFVAGLPRLRLRGLMTIPRATEDLERSRAVFRRVASAFAAMRPDGSTDWDSLSMGMTADFETAIAEGATMIRLGTAIFGPRSGR
jgi:hypothetical protein